MSRWYNNAEAPDIVYVARLGDPVAYRDLPNDLKTDPVAQYFGAVPDSVLAGGVVVCGSVGEVSNDPTMYESFDVRSDQRATFDTDDYDNQKHVVWVEIAQSGKDQLRQRMAWALAQILTTVSRDGMQITFCVWIRSMLTRCANSSQVPANINARDRTEIYTNYYDIFVRHAFGNYRDILKETSFQPIMAEHLSYLRSKSHSYVYEDEGKRTSRADENFASKARRVAWSLSSSS